MINFLKQIFTWWNRQTLGVFIYTLLTGKFVGEDEFGNKYYSNSKGKRWVVYKSRVESSKIPPEWHLWIHFLTNNKPSKNSFKFNWQKKHESNIFILFPIIHFNIFNISSGVVDVYIFVPNFSQ